MESSAKFWLSFWVIVFGSWALVEIFGYAGEIGIAKINAEVEFAKLKDCK